MNINTKMTNYNIKKGISPKISKKYILRFFPENVRNLRLLFHYSQNYLAEYLKINIEQYRKYETEDELINVELIKKLQMLYDL